MNLTIYISVGILIVLRFIIFDLYTVETIQEKSESGKRIYYEPESWETRRYVAIRSIPSNNEGVKIVCTRDLSVALDCIEDSEYIWIITNFWWMHDLRRNKNPETRPWLYSKHIIMASCFAHNAQWKSVLDSYDQAQGVIRWSNYSKLEGYKNWLATVLKEKQWQ